MTKPILKALLKDLCRKAEVTPKRRQHSNLHDSYSEPCQRLFNAICVDSYIRPHRHSADGNVESLFAMRGRFALVVFDDLGRISNMVPFSGGFAGAFEDDSVGCEVLPSEWHTVLALAADSVLLELKAGPYDSSLAKDFAPWSPAEDSVESVDYLHGIRVEVMARLARREVIQQART